MLKLADKLPLTGLPSHQAHDEVDDTQEQPGDPQSSAPDADDEENG
jgi:hypothetical protein